MKSDDNNSNLDIIIIDHHNMDCVYGGPCIVTLLCYRDNDKPNAYPHPNYSRYHAGYCM
jgi:hypothetical protein